MGFFCVDTCHTLIPTFADLVVRSQQSPHRVAWASTSAPASTCRI